MPVISKKFANELSEKEMRDAYLDAQTRAKLAQQIRTLRAQRGLSQGALGELMGGKPQGNIARLEDRNVGRYTLTTLLELAAAYDVGLVAKFVPYEDFLRDTEDLSPDNLKVASFNRAQLDDLCSDAETTVDFVWPTLNEIPGTALAGYCFNSPTVPVALTLPSGMSAHHFNVFSLISPGQRRRPRASLNMSIFSTGGASICAEPSESDARQEVRQLKMELAKKRREIAALENECKALKEQNQSSLNDIDIPAPHMLPQLNKQGHLQ